MSAPWKKKTWQILGEKQLPQKFCWVEWITGALPGHHCWCILPQGRKGNVAFVLSISGLSFNSVIMEEGENGCLGNRKGLCPSPSTGPWNPVSFGKESGVHSHMLWNLFSTGGDLRAFVNTGFGMGRQQWASRDTWGCWECLKII